MNRQAGHVRDYWGTTLSKQVFYWFCRRVEFIDREYSQHELCNAVLLEVDVLSKFPAVLFIHIYQKILKLVHLVWLYIDLLYWIMAELHDLTWDILTVNLQWKYYLVNPIFLSKTGSSSVAQRASSSAKLWREKRFQMNGRKRSNKSVYSTVVEMISKYS